MSSLQEVCVADLGRVVTGKTPSTKNPIFFGGQFQFVTPSDLNFQHYYCRKTETTVTDEARSKHANQFIPANSIMFTCIGNTIGKCAISSEDCLTNQQINTIIPHSPEYAKFIYYLLNQNIEVFRGIGMSGGVATPIINKTSFSNVKISAPPKETWLGIGDLLSAYDDLIENNFRRIQLLEDSIKLLYKEWFINFCFPGHEHVKIDGGVPEGWKYLSIKDCCASVSYGYTASSSLEKVGPKFLRITDIVPSFIDWDSVPYCEIGDKEKTKLTLVAGDVVVARTGATVGYAKQLHSTEDDVVYASYLVRFRPDSEIIDNLIFGTFMESKEYKEFVRSNAGGAAQPNANAQILGAAKLLVPTKEIQQLFRSYCEDFFKLRGNLIKQIALLRKSRNLLLPRLMNGDITV